MVPVTVDAVTLWSMARCLRRLGSLKFSELAEIHMHALVGLHQNCAVARASDFQAIDALRKLPLRCYTCPHGLAGMAGLAGAA